MNGRTRRNSPVSLRVILISLGITIGGFLAGIVVGPFLWQPAPSDPGEIVWPLYISVNFEGTPANATLHFTVAVEKDNDTLGSTSYSVARLAPDRDWVYLFFGPTVQAAPQSLEVVFELDGGIVSDFQFEVHPDTDFASPRPHFIISYGSPASFIPPPDATWFVHVTNVGR